MNAAASRLPKAYFNWSTGKDASFALHLMQQGGNLQVDRLLTTINAHHDRVSMHGLRREMMELQAEAIGLPLTTVELPEQPSMDEYAELMEKAVVDLQGEGYEHCGFGDIFLEDLRQYREEQLKPFGIHCHFPLWKRDTKSLVEEFIQLGFRAVVVCTKAELLGESFVGREIDTDFLRDLPDGVDPCGENGEFHTFCFDGPLFSSPVAYHLGEKVFREYKHPDPDAVVEGMGFWFVDVLPG